VGFHPPVGKITVAPPLASELAPISILRQVSVKSQYPSVLQSIGSPEISQLSEMRLTDRLD
jgi:hypothetical protein